VIAADAARMLAMVRPLIESVVSLMPLKSSAERRSMPAMSYRARIAYPLLMVTGRTGACGNTNRSAGSPPWSSGTNGSKSWPSAPRPCIQMMV